MNDLNTNNTFNALKLTELKTLCKEKGLPVSGTKAELVARLTGEPIAKSTATTTNTTGKPVSKSTTKPKTKPVSTLQKPVFQQFLDQKPMVIKRNVHGNFEHPETHLVFSQNKKIIGVQNPSGTIDPLTVDDIQNVYKYHFELEEGVRVQDKSTNPIAKDESLKEKRVQELLKLTQID
jgi:hypothetical protein